MPVRISEIDAYAAARPFGPALDGNAMAGKALLPLREFVGADRKGEMKRSLAVVGRDRAARHAHGFARSAAEKHEQHALAADVVAAKSGIAPEQRQGQNVFVEPGRTLE